MVDGGAGGGVGGSGVCLGCDIERAGVRTGDGIIVIYYVSSYTASVASAGSRSSSAAAGSSRWHRG